MTTLPLLGRRVQISGSASAKTDPALVRYAHGLVRNLVREIMAAGGGIVVGVAGRCSSRALPRNAPSFLLFDWDGTEDCRRLSRACRISAVARRFWASPL